MRSSPAIPEGALMDSPGVHGPIRALQGSPPPDPGTKSVGETLVEKRAGKPRIRCPKCAWQPRPEDRWACSMCNRGVWNTFDTRGVCPACKHRWTFTQCLSCQGWSLHADWYEKQA